MPRKVLSARQRIELGLIPGVSPYDIAERAALEAEQEGIEPEPCGGCDEEKPVYDFPPPPDVVLAAEEDQDLPAGSGDEPEPAEPEEE